MADLISLLREQQQMCERATLEQRDVKLAGCSVAALGGVKDVAKPGDYGWSPAYQDVLDLRLKYEALEQRNRELEAVVKIAAGEEAEELASKFARDLRLAYDRVRELENELDAFRAALQEGK
jgi:hypothetical protein